VLRCVFAYFGVFVYSGVRSVNVFLCGAYLCVLFMCCVYFTISDSPESVIPLLYASRLFYLDLPVVYTTIPIAVLLLTLPSQVRP